MLKRTTLIKIFLTILCLVLGSYYAFTHFSAHYFIQKFLTELDIPLQLKDAKWSIKLSDLLKGKINRLEIYGYYTPLKKNLRISTPVEYLKKRNHWSIQLKPILSIDQLPTVLGTINLELEKLADKEINFSLRNDQKLYYQFANSSIAIDLLNLHGVLNLNQNAHLKTNFRGEELVLNIDHKIFNIKNVSGNLETKFSNDFNRFDGQIFIDLPVFANLKFNSNLNHTTQHYETALKFESIDKTAKLIAFLDPHLISRGKFHFTSQINLIDTMLFDLTALFKLKNNFLAFENQKLNVAGLNFSQNYTLNEQSGFGQLSIDTLSYKKYKISNLKLFSEIEDNILYFSTKDQQSLDHPIQQNFLDSSIRVSNLLIKVNPNLEYSLSLAGGPFQLKALQNAFCFAFSNSLSGSLSFNYPELIQQRDSLHFKGKAEASIFNGKITAGDFDLFYKEAQPRLKVSIAINDLDLKAIADWIDFGDMRGSIFANLNDGSFWLTDYGPIPISYDFSFYGAKRSDKKMSFYGRAVDNILKLFGAPREELPWTASWPLKIAMAFRNWLPATADYFGFHAKSDQNWTELSTLDPVDAKKHYILYGSAFTIPLNTHGVYPVIMKTSSFQGWLTGMLDYFKKLIQRKNNNENSQPNCIPIWQTN